MERKILHRLLRDMMLSRTFEERAAEEYTKGNIVGFLHLYPGEAVYQQLVADRQQARQALLDALHEWKCVPAKFSKNARRVVMTPILNRGLHRYVALSQSALLGLQPEDWLDMALPVNVPGTTDQYPNWRRKLSRNVGEIFEDQQIIRLLREVGRLRNKRREETDDKPDTIRLLKR